mgnify:CR=1 FL=1
MKFESEELYLKSEEEMKLLFPEQQEAMNNTLKIASLCRFDFEFGHYHLPKFKLPEGENSSSVYLRKLCEEGFAKRFADRPEVHSQLEYELDMIEKMGFVDYFLIVADFIGYANRNGIPVGPGRGSAAGSVVSYCLNITDVDPIKYSLFFERFLNPERVSMPDIDVDFCVIDLYPGAPKVSGKDDEGNDVFAAYGNLPGGDVITAAAYNKLAQEYKNGPYVNGMTLSDFTLSHIMMQKWVAYFPYGSSEAWVDLRKYMYDIAYSGEYPTLDNGWTLTTVNSKRDDDATKVYKGFYLLPSQVQGRRGTFNVDNHGSPCFRIRPRYNSEYMWNKDGLDAIKPIGGRALNYQCSIPWFAFPGDMPASLPEYY